MSFLSGYVIPERTCHPERSRRIRNSCVEHERKRVHSERICHPERSRRNYQATPASSTRGSESILSGYVIPERTCHPGRSRRIRTSCVEHERKRIHPERLCHPERSRRNYQATPASSTRGSESILSDYVILSAVEGTIKHLLRRAREQAGPF